MTTEAPVERIVSILESSRAFRRVSTPIKIGNVPFDFSAVLLGTGKNPDLVIVIDTINEDDHRTRQKIGGLGRAMDVVGSRRPVTAILTGPPPDQATIELMGRVCRVLPVGTPDGANDLNDWLSVLLPLELPSHEALAADPIGEVKRTLPQGIRSELSKVILGAALQGPSAVRDALKRQLQAPLERSDMAQEGFEEES